MVPDFSVRYSGQERMDSEACCERQLLRTVDQFASLNLLFSRSRRLVRELLFPLMKAGRARTYRLVDLGAGGCDLSVWMLEEARRLGVTLEVVAVESDPRIVNHVRRRRLAAEGLDIRRGNALDAGAWPDCDFVFANHFLHHLGDQEVKRVVDLAARKVGVRALFNDLLRSRVSYAGYRVTAPLLYRDSFAVEDGLLSIRRGFTRAELERHIRELGLQGRARVLTKLPGRIALVLDGIPLSVMPAGRPAGS